MSPRVCTCACRCAHTLGFGMSPGMNTDSPSVYVSECMYTSLCMCEYACGYMCIWYICVHMYVWEMYVYVHVYGSMSVGMYMSVCMYEYMCE